MKRWRTFVRGLGVFGLFAGAGPLIGGFVFGLVLIVQALSDPAPDGVSALVSLPFFSAMLGYLAGLLPAAVTGAVSAFVSPWLADDRKWIGLSVAVGALVSWVNLVPLRNGYPSDDPDALTVALVCLMGALAALLCGWASRGFRPLPRRRIRPSDSG